MTVLGFQLTVIIFELGFIIGILLVKDSFRSKK